MGDEIDLEARRLNRKLANAKREVVKGVERAAKVDLRRGHYVEAARRCRAIMDECDRAITKLNEGR